MGTEADYIPKRRLLQNVTVEQKPTVTTTEDHEYNVGDIVRIIVPLLYGMDIDHKVAKVLTVPASTTFTMDLDTTSQNAFTAPAAPYTPAQVVPIAGQSTDNIAS
jgi:hypothetical protein